MALERRRHTPRDAAVVAAAIDLSKPAPPLRGAGPLNHTGITGQDVARIVSEAGAAVDQNRIVRMALRSAMIGSGVWATLLGVLYVLQQGQLDLTRGMPAVVMGSIAVVGGLTITVSTALGRRGGRQVGCVLALSMLAWSCAAQYLDDGSAIGLAFRLAATWPILLWVLPIEA